MSLVKVRSWIKILADAIFIFSSRISRATKQNISYFPSLIAALFAATFSIVTNTKCVNYMLPEITANLFIFTVECYCLTLSYFQQNYNNRTTTERLCKDNVREGDKRFQFVG